MLWINGKMTDLTKKDAIHKLVDAKGFLERYSNPHDKWTEAINIGIEAIEIVMDQEEQEPTTKNDLGVDCISRQAVIDLMMQKWGENFSGDSAMQESIDAIRVMPSVTSQEPFINKPCVSSGVCEHDKNVVLDKIRAEIRWKIKFNFFHEGYVLYDDITEVLDKYKSESEGKK